MIGAGKSTLAKALGETLNLPVYYEPVMDNEYLADYYKDMKKYAFPLQIYLLNRRFKQQQQIIWAGKGGVQDRTIYEDAVFARMLCKAGHIEQRDYETYLSLFNNMVSTRICSGKFALATVDVGRCILFYFFLHTAHLLSNLIGACNMGYLSSTCSLGMHDRGWTLCQLDTI